MRIVERYTVAVNHKHVAYLVFSGGDDNDYAITYIENGDHLNLSMKDPRRLAYYVLDLISRRHGDSFELKARPDPKDEATMKGFNDWKNSQMSIL